MSAIIILPFRSTFLYQSPLKYKQESRNYYHLTTKAIQLKNHDTEDALHQEIRKSNNGRYQHRLRTILLVKRGLSCKRYTSRVIDIFRNIL